MRFGKRFWTDSLTAAVLAGILGGIPSTAWALVNRGDAWEAALAVGAIMLGSDAPFSRLIASAIVFHGVMSFFWAAVLCAFLPPRRRMLWGLIAGALIAVLDILLIGQAIPAIRSLAFVPQLADHLMFGVIVGAVVDHQRSLPSRK